jgi:tetratricopeptide (TPR) repeat protein
MTNTTKPKSRRTYNVAPPPDWPESFYLLAEVPEPLSTILWTTARSIQLWSVASPKKRHGMFSCLPENVRQEYELARLEAPELDGTFDVFATLRINPEAVQRRQLATACHDVAEWAEHRSLLKVGALFAHAAAYAEPANPARANVAGKLCRRAALFDLSGMWYDRGFDLAVRWRKRGQAIRALLGHGGLLYTMGAYREARPFLKRAAKRADRAGREKQVAEASHDLLTITAALGEFTHALEHVEAALENYPIHHPRIPYLVHDIGYLWMQHGLFNASLQLFELALRYIRRPGERALVLTAIARAAAGKGDQVRFLGAQEEGLALLGQHEEHAPSGFRNLAVAASHLGQWGAARDFALSSQAASRRRGERDVETDTQDILDRISRCELSPASSGATPPLQAVAKINKECRIRLSAWIKPGRGRPGLWTKERFYC